ncbi:hypothetical protein GCM10010980_23630 [Corynebacterium marinum]|nr:hypothetical protein GCM10010980_23630 [Corynebacterium marinum]
MFFPPEGTPVSSDAVVVLAGSADGRHQLGAQMVDQGDAENFVVSNPRKELDKVGTAHCRGVSRPETATGVWCLEPDPVTTTGEAMAVGELAEKEDWSNITVLTHRPHTRRVQAIFNKCTNLEVVVVPLERIIWTRILYQTSREIAGFAKFWITNPCRDLP